MTAETAEIAVFGFAAATLVHAVFAVLLLRDPGFGTVNRLSSRAFAGAVLASVAWAAAGLGDQFSPYLVTRQAVMGLDWLRYGLWLLFLGALVRPMLLAPGSRRLGGLGATALGLWLTGAPQRRRWTACT